MKRYDWRINKEGDEEEYQTLTGRYMHSTEVLQHINEVCALLPKILAPIGQESEWYVFEITQQLRQG